MRSKKSKICVMFGTPHRGSFLGKSTYMLVFPDHQLVLLLTQLLLEVQSCQDWLEKKFCCVLGGIQHPGELRNH
jgi:hypothetical protein